MSFNANLFAGWAAFLAGALSGALIGLFFHREDWLGGYGSFRRRLLRLGHIACVGLGLINVLFALTAPKLRGGSAPLGWASALLLIGLLTMPLVCFLSAWRPPFRHLFFIPVIASSAGMVCVLLAFP